MHLPYGQLNLGLDLKLNIEAQEETKANGIERLYQLKVAQNIEHLIFRFFVFEVTNGLLLL